MFWVIDRSEKTWKLTIFENAINNMFLGLPFLIITDLALILVGAITGCLDYPKSF